MPMPPAVLSTFASSEEAGLHNTNVKECVRRETLNSSLKIFLRVRKCSDTNMICKVQWPCHASCDIMQVTWAILSLAHPSMDRNEPQLLGLWCTAVQSEVCKENSITISSIRERGASILSICVAFFESLAKDDKVVQFVKGTERMGRPALLCSGRRNRIAYLMEFGMVCHIVFPPPPIILSFFAWFSPPQSKSSPGVRLT